MNMAPFICKMSRQEQVVWQMYRVRGQIFNQEFSFFEAVRLFTHYIFMSLSLTGYFVAARRVAWDEITPISFSFFLCFLKFVPVDLRIQGLL